MHAAVLLAELVPARPVAGRVAREDRRQLRVGQLERVAGRDPHPRAVGRATAGNETTLSSTMTSGRSSSKISRSRSSTYFEPSTSACHVGWMKPSSCSIVGLRNTGSGVADEVLPELARLLLRLGRRLEPHQPLLEALLLERAREGLLDHEHDPVPALPERLPDADAVVRRPVGALREEDDRRHYSALVRRATQTSSPGHAAPSRAACNSAPRRPGRRARRARGAPRPRSRCRAGARSARRGAGGSRCCPSGSGQSMRPRPRCGRTSRSCVGVLARPACRARRAPSGTGRSAGRRAGAADGRCWDPDVWVAPDGRAELRRRRCRRSRPAAAGPPRSRGSAGTRSRAPPGAAGRRELLLGEVEPDRRSRRASLNQAHQ